MIREIIEVLKVGKVDDKFIHLDNICIDDNNIKPIKYLHEKNCFEDFIDSNDINIGKRISTNITWAELSTVGVFKDKCSFVINNQYECVSEYYIWDIGCFHDEIQAFIKSYTKTLELISALIGISSHCWEDEDCKHIIISHSNNTLVLDIEYNSKNISLEKNYIDNIEYLTDVLSTNNEKQRLFINEIIDFLSKSKEGHNLSQILDSIITINTNAERAYDFYLSNFSTNKLKFEIDSKAIDFTQKIQSVINDAQTKLIAIPTAFVLATAAMDFDKGKILSSKNITIIISLFIFALLIQLFLNNQKSILEFMKLNIKEYKDAINLNNKNISTSFTKVDKALLDQLRRLYIIQAVLWLIPAALFMYLLFVYYTLNICTILTIVFLPIFMYILLVIKIMMK